MHIVSVNVGLPRDVPWRGGTVRTGIFKDPVAGRIALRRLNFDGDGQADLAVHGGRDKAVYAYPAEHYDYWRSELPDRPLPWGSFGENLSTSGLLEGSVHIGDAFRVGKALLTVTQPRMPCYKLGVRFGTPAMVKRFLASRRPGIYFAVLEEGEVGAGDPVELVREDERRVSIADVLRLIVRDEEDAGLLRRALEVPALAASLREGFERRLASPEVRTEGAGIGASGPDPGAKPGGPHYHSGVSRMSGAGSGESPGRGDDAAEAGEGGR